MRSICSVLLVVAFVKVLTLGDRFPPNRPPKTMKDFALLDEQKHRARRDLHEEVEQKDIMKPANETAPNEQKEKQRGTEARLLKDLFRYYNRDVFPGTPTPITLEINYLCASYDPPSHLLTSRTWMYFSWTDERLKWHASEYDGIDELRIGVQKIWIPDIRLYNGAEAEEKDSEPAIVYESGNCYWIPPVTFKSYCVNNGDRAATCNLKFGSWTFDAQDVPLKAPSNDRDLLNTYSYLEGCPYNLTNHVAHINRTVYECCTEPYDTLTVQLNIIKND